MIKLFFILAVTRCDRFTRRLYSHVLNVYSTISKRTWLGEYITRSKYLKNGYKYFSLYNYQGNSVRAFLHEGGEPQIGEVTPLGGVKKITLLYMQSYNPAILGCTFSRLLNGR